MATTKARTTNPFSQPAKTAGKTAPVGTGTVLAPTQTYSAPASASSGGGGGGYVGGGGGGGAAAGAMAPVPQMSFDDYIAKDFGYTQTQNENARRLTDFDAQTLLQRQQAEADQGMRRAALQQTLSQMGGDWANDAANRGILRSGLYLQGQDKVDQAGVTGNQDIDQILTDLIASRQSEKVALEQQNRSALNDVLSQLSQKYNSGLQLA